MPGETTWSTARRSARARTQGTARRALAALGLAALTSVTGCGSTVGLELSFPNESAFLVSRTVRLSVVPLGADALGRCPALLADAARGVDLGATLTAEESVCDVRGGLGLPDPGTGPRAFVAEVLDDRSTAILTGCTVGEAYPGASPIRVALFPTERFAESAARLAPPPGTTADSFCSAGGGR